MHYLILTTLALALGGIPEAAGRAPRGKGQPAGDLRERVETFLATIDTPVTERQWRELGPDAAPLLLEIASARDQLPTRRARAVEALGMRQDAGAAKVVNDLATAAGTPRAVRLAAVRAVPRLSRATAQAALGPLLQDADVQVRAAAAGALATLGAGGCRLVAERLAREAGEARALLERTSAACRKP